ncbi:MAG: MotA/TolQ/ExbB proton channel family protein [Spirochaetes bacterium]|nr:MotA/TolQ/ExbB proton channel family protein [Spirochaetota bacterium]
MPDQIINFFLDGGPVIMGLIFLCSLAAIFIIIERLLYFRKINLNDEKIIDRLTSAINKKRYDEALAICDTAPSPVTNLMKAGIKYRSYNEHHIQDSIKDAAALEIPKLEKFLTTLGTIANIAPLLGLLGTVIGNMEAFGLIGEKAAIGNMELLAGGISKALMTTAFGLSVAIPAAIFYNFLTNRVNHMILELETKANELVLLLVKGRESNNGH